MKSQIDMHEFFFSLSLSLPHSRLPNNQIDQNESTVNKINRKHHNRRSKKGIFIASLLALFGNYPGGENEMWEQLLCGRRALKSRDLEKWKSKYEFELPTCGPYVSDTRKNRIQLQWRTRKPFDIEISS